MTEIISALLCEDATPQDIAGLPLPESYRGVVVRREDEDMFEGMAAADKDPRKSLHLREIPLPLPSPGEVLVAVLASSMNSHSVAASLFEPRSAFGLLEQYAELSPATARHALPYHVIGSDLAGVVLRTGPGVHRWKAGDRVVAHCLSEGPEPADARDDARPGSGQRLWGHETNFGGLAELALVGSGQLMPKPEHLTWEEAAAPGLAHSTAYRRLVSANGARMKQGDNVLIWGAGGGIGSYATQLALAGGATPICVVSDPRKAEICRAAGAAAVIDRSAEGYRFRTDGHAQDPRAWQRFGEHVRELTGGEDVDIVLAHPGRETFGASAHVARKGGTVVASASPADDGRMYDDHCPASVPLAHKRVIAPGFADRREAWEANRLLVKGRIHPTLSTVYPLAETGQAAYDVRRNLHRGKVGVLALAPRQGLGVRDHETRARHIDAINRFRDSRVPGRQGPPAT
ncbi:MAG: crotonyl-CoA carboxylase/reductase [Streptomyces sp.]